MSAWVDFALMLLTFVFTLAWSVEGGILVSVTVSLLLVVRGASRANIKILVSIHAPGIYYNGSDNHASQGRIPGTDRWKPVDENPEAEDQAVSGALIVRIRESLDFGMPTSHPLRRHV
jgi:MFS superfamily sulfate permease-like transporter